MSSGIVTKQYHAMLRQSWTSISNATITDIPVSKADLIGRIKDTRFGEDRTTQWMMSASVRTWRAVRDPHTGHTIHVVSDRAFHDKTLTRDLLLGLRLLAFMSANTPVTWYWWDQPWDRILPPNTLPRQEHLNGGFAVPGIPEVHVYRREEAHKVMIHEVIHALNLDVTGPVLDSTRSQLESVLGFTLWQHLGEAYTELMAEFLYSATVGGSWTAWIRQQECSETQAAEVWARNRNRTDAENTSVFSYYILKWVLMNTGHCDEVLLSPQASVNHWFIWFLDAQPKLNRLADVAQSQGTLSQSIQMGMTCYSRPRI